MSAGGSGASRARRRAHRRGGEKIPGFIAATREKWGSSRPPKVSCVESSRAPFLSEVGARSVSVCLLGFGGRQATLEVVTVKGLRFVFGQEGGAGLFGVGPGRQVDIERAPGDDGVDRQGSP